MECISRAIELHKQAVNDPKTGAETYKVGFKIGGGIDQDPTKSPYNYPDTVGVVLFTYPAITD